MRLFAVLLLIAFSAANPVRCFQKTVHVRQYTRKDGTVVRAYDRAAPGTASQDKSSAKGQVPVDNSSAAFQGQPIEGSRSTETNGTVAEGDDGPAPGSATPKKAASAADAEPTTAPPVAPPLNTHLGCRAPDSTSRTSQKLTSLAKAEESGVIVVRFTSAPKGADVNVDGAYWGGTPTIELNLPPGPHLVVVKKLGYQPWERKITLAPGDDCTVNAKLESQRNDGTKPRIAGY